MASLRRDNGYALFDSQVASQSTSQSQSLQNTNTNTSRRPASHSHTPHLSPLSPLSPASPLSPSSPTSYTLSSKRQHHQVRIQGRLMLVKSVSSNAINAASRASSPAREDADADTNANYYANPRESYTKAVERDQRRGYGIGGAGNIRRPTEVLHFYSTSNRTVADDGPRKRRWQWMNSLLGRKERSSYSYEKY